MLRISLAIFVLFALPALSAYHWEKLDHCRLVTNVANDGDSFHVKHDGQEYIFRLYYVDTPEVDDDFPDRVAEQAAYFGLSHRRALDLGRAAQRFTARQLAGQEFTVTTRWDDARGRSKLARHYAFITINKHDLGQLLVENGLARVFGEKAILPNGESTKAAELKLRQLERVAKAAHVGGWVKHD